MPWRWTVVLATALAGLLAGESRARADRSQGGGRDAPPSLELHGGEVLNASGSCGRPLALTVQFLGPVSPRLELEPGAVQAVSLARGFYQAAIQTSDGTPVESPLVVIEGKGFSLSFGCPPIPGHSDSPSRPALPHNPASVPVRFANTTGDCGDPRTVVFVVNNSPTATLPAGGVSGGSVPGSGFLLEVASLPENKRLFVRRVAGIKSGESLYYGCTDPDFVSRKDGVAVVFENATDSCPSPGPLTLWVDGWPRLGLPPGRATTVFLSKGFHDFEVGPGLLTTRFLRGSRDVAAPFRIRYGCFVQD